MILLKRIWFYVNDLSDGFLSKFGKYIFVEAKNRPSVPVKKDDFVVFRAKLDSSNQLAELGIIVSAFNVASTVRLEALRTSKESGKILLFHIMNWCAWLWQMINYMNLKKLIDEQIKDIPVWDYQAAWNNLGCLNFMINYFLDFLLHLNWFALLISGCKYSRCRPSGAVPPWLTSFRGQFQAWNPTQ